MINGEASDEREWKELEREMMGERASGQGWKTDQVKAEGKLKDDEALVGGMFPFSDLPSDTSEDRLRDVLLRTETFYLELPITNPLEAFLSIGGLSLEIETQGDTQGKLEMDQTPEGDLIELAPLESRIVSLFTQYVSDASRMLIDTRSNRFACQFEAILRERIRSAPFPIVSTTSFPSPKLSNTPRSVVLLPRRH